MSAQTHWFKLVYASLLVTAAGAGAGRAVLPAPDYVEGEVLVQFRPAETWESAQLTATWHTLEMARRFGWLSEHLGRVTCLLRSPTQTTASLIAELRQDPVVALVEPNHLRQTTHCSASYGACRTPVRSSLAPPAQPARTLVS